MGLSSLVGRGRVVAAVAVAALLAGGALLAGWERAEGAVITNTTIPFEFKGGPPAECLEEVVSVSGALHVVSTATEDGAGGRHVNLVFNLKDVSGVGQTTGTRYRGSGVTRLNKNIRPPYPSTFTASNKFQLIGQGSGKDFALNATIHFAADANGNLTARVLKVDSSCR